MLLLAEPVSYGREMVPLCSDTPDVSGKRTVTPDDRYSGPVEHLETGMFLHGIVYLLPFTDYPDITYPNIRWA